MVSVRMNLFNIKKAFIRTVPAACQTMVLFVILALPVLHHLHHAELGNSHRQHNCSYGTVYADEAGQTAAIRKAPVHIGHGQCAICLFLSVNHLTKPVSFKVFSLYAIPYNPLPEVPEAPVKLLTGKANCSRAPPA